MVGMVRGDDGGDGGQGSGGRFWPGSSTSTLITPSYMTPTQISATIPVHHPQRREEKRRGPR
eukprot:6792493-Pyramimonas_sp.AAC.1